ncbi:Sodium:solute symporter family-domain-containing protein [Phyllosticta capitalensis]|uniref:Sodium:solute symporter family-domain-containing protein n=1 Tax=Phyllosticta capitalensis TaxID=121624 RepID=UPI00312EACA9
MVAEHTIKVLPAGAGYGIVIGIGGVFAIIMLGLTWLQNRYTTFSTMNSEEFNTASRSIKPGLIAAGIVSSWTWSATLLTSSTFAYTYGVCGPMWYGALGCFQIFLFALIAIKIKGYTPGAHTFPEIVLAKHGKVAHITYLVAGLVTNMLVGACLVLGGSQVVEALSGMNVYASCFLIPLVVASYVIAGGLRSTFIADYLHTVILFVVIMVFGFLVYATSDTIGSTGKFYDLLVEASEKMPIATNVDGSYLSFRSVDGLVFAMDLLVCGFCCVWLDQAYWQRAIASRPETSIKAYLLGGFAWYGIPFGFATAMGLGCAALTSNPKFPTYPDPLSTAQNNAGLSSPATAITLLGNSGAILMLILLFMAITSSTSAELIAVSSLITFDIFQTYMRPNSTPQTLVKVSHIGIVICAVVLAAFCCILNAIGLTLTWLLTCFGVMVGGASVPVGLVLLWDQMSTIAVIFSPYIALAMGLIAWLVSTEKRSGSISIDTLGNTVNAVAGNMCSALGGFVVAVILSYLFPWKHVNTDPKAIERARKIEGIFDDGSASPSASHEEALDKKGTEVKVSDQADDSNESKKDATVTSVHDATGTDDSLKKKPAPPVYTGNELVDYLQTNHAQRLDPEAVRKGTRLAVIANVGFVLIACILVPFTLFGDSYVYNKPFFSGWCVVSFIWVWASMTICVIYPVVESRNAVVFVCRGLARDFLSAVGMRAKETGGDRPQRV